jgi:hypothetical protein
MPISKIFYRAASTLTAFGFSLMARWKLSILKNTIPSLKNADVLILGSSPSPTLLDEHRNRLLICCNASAANAKQLGLSEPVITVVDYELIDPNVVLSKVVRGKIIKKRILAQLNLGHLVATQSNNAVGGCPHLLKANYNGYTAIDRFSRRKIIDIVTGVNKIDRAPEVSLSSTGGFAVALALFLGARSVSIAGFTHIFKGDKCYQMHFYDDVVNNEINSLNTRNHSMADSALISLAVINGHKIITSEEDILPLIQNWGNSGPSW